MGTGLSKDMRASNVPHTRLKDLEEANSQPPPFTRPHAEPPRPPPIEPPDMEYVRRARQEQAPRPAVPPHQLSPKLERPTLEPPKTEYIQRAPPEYASHSAEQLVVGNISAVSWVPLNMAERTISPGKLVMKEGSQGEISGFRRGGMTANRATSKLLSQARSLPGRCRPVCVSLAEVELSPPGLRKYLRPMILSVGSLLVAALAAVSIIYWTPAYRLYWLNEPDPVNATAFTNVSDISSFTLLEMAPMPPNCHRFDKNSGRLTSGVQAMLNTAIKTPYIVDALPNEPQYLAPGTSLVMKSLVVDEVSHGQWTFGLCWGQPWYESVPDQLVLRLRRIGLIATLTMQILQHIPMVGDVVLTTGSATVQGHGVIFLDDIDLEEISRPVKTCSGRFFFRIHSASFDVGGYGAGVGNILDDIDVGAVFPVQDALCFGNSGTTLSEINAMQANASSSGNVTGAAAMVNEMVWHMMPQVSMATEALLNASTIVVVLALATLAVIVFLGAYFIHDDSLVALGRVLVAFVSLGVFVGIMSYADPFAAATGSLVVLVLFSLWRSMACIGYFISVGLATAQGRRVILLILLILGAMARVAYVYRGTTSARWLFLTCIVMVSAGSAFCLSLPLCMLRTRGAFRAISIASARANDIDDAPLAGDALEDGSRVDRTAMRISLFRDFNLRLGGLPRCLVSMLTALILAGFVVVFSALHFSREINSRLFLPPSPPPPTAPAPPSLPFSPQAVLGSILDNPDSYELERHNKQD